MLFEDEENNGLGRERQFKWKNVDNHMNLDDNRLANDDDVGLRESDDENEEQWRRMRHERALMLKSEKESNQTDASAPETISLIKKRITIMKSANTTPQYSLKNSPFLISKALSATTNVSSYHFKMVVYFKIIINSIQTTRCSFLGRDEHTLSKLATLSKVSDIDGNDVVMASAIGKAKNFVFSTKSPVPVEKV